MPYIHSPCINQCQLSDDKVCLSCHRTLQEICDWSKASNVEKQTILDRLAALKQKSEDSTDAT